MKRMLVRPGVAVVLGLAALLAAGGIAYATIPDSNGVIHACYKTTGGALRVIDSGAGGACNASETPVSWSQTGPQGQQGLEGPRGPSDVWFFDGSHDSQNIGGGGFVTLASLDLPAGSYLVEGQTAVFDTSTGTKYGCDLVNSSTHEYQEAAGSTPDATNDATEIPIQTVLTLSGPDTISLRCDGVDAGAGASYWSLAALEVGTVH